MTKTDPEAEAKLAAAVRSASGLPERMHSDSAQAVAEVVAAFEPELTSEQKSPARWAAEKPGALGL